MHQKKKNNIKKVTSSAVDEASATREWKIFPSLIILQTCCCQGEDVAFS